MRLYHIFIASFLPLAFGCGLSSGAHSPSLTGKELRMLDSLHIDTSIVYEIRKYNSSEIEPFHYSRSKMYADGKETEVNPIRLNGILFKEKGTETVQALADEMKLERRLYFWWD